MIQSKQTTSHAPAMVLKPVFLACVLCTGTATHAQGITDFGVLNGGTNSQAYGINAAGDVAVGSAANGAAGNAVTAYRWTPDGGFTSLGMLNGGNQSNAYAINSQGDVIVGMAADGAAGSAGGVSYNASTSKSQGQGSGTDESYTNTRVEAGNTVTLKSGADTTLRGAVVSANQIKADVGGNLAIESLQDKSTYQETNQSSGGSISLSASGIPTGGSLSSGKSNIDSNFQSVTEQSSLKAGDGGFQVSVAGNTDLKGGAITSTQSALDQARNSFTTGGSLTTSDIQNSASYSAKGSGATIGVGSELNKSGMGIGDKSGEAGSTTQAAISGIAGNTAARTGDAETGIKPIFDRDAVRNDVNAQVAITTEFGKQAGKAVGDYAQQKLNEALASGDQAEIDKWKEGGSARLGLHAVVGALTGSLRGALGVASSQAVVPVLGDQLKGLDIPIEVKQALLQVAGAVVGTATGGMAGTASGLNATATNYLTHTELKTQKEMKDLCKAGNSSACDMAKLYDALSQLRQATGNAGCLGNDATVCETQIANQKSAIAGLEDAKKEATRKLAEAKTPEQAREAREYLNTIEMNERQAASLLKTNYEVLKQEGLATLDQLNELANLNAKYGGMDTTMALMGAAIINRNGPATSKKAATKEPSEPVPPSDTASPPSRATTEPDADFAGQIPVRPRDGDVAPGTPVTDTPLGLHLIGAQVTGTGRNAVISGGHNMDNFQAALATAGGSLIGKPVEIAPGIFEVQYQLPGGRVQPKTVYDPAKYSDAQMANMASEAAAKAIIQWGTNGNPKQIVEINGVSFYIPISNRGGKPHVPTAFPVDPKKVLQ